MRKIILQALLYIFLFLFACPFAWPAYAHGSEPRLEISVERLNLGGVIEVRGVEFDYEQSVTLYLERPGILIQLGEVVTDLEGTFLHIVVLPIDLSPGVYNVRAVADHHEILGPALTIEGSPILDDGRGQDGRDEHEGFSAPIPTYAPGVVPGRVSQPEPTNPVPDTSLETTTSPTWNIPVLIFSFLFSIGIILWWRRRFARG